MGLIGITPKLIGARIIPPFQVITLRSAFVICRFGNWMFRGSDKYASQNYFFNNLVYCANNIQSLSLLYSESFISYILSGLTVNTIWIMSQHSMQQDL